MTTLLEILTSDLSYDSKIGIWAEKIEGRFSPDSPARLGQFLFKNGGILDEYQEFSSNEHAIDFLSSYWDDVEEVDEDMKKEASFRLIDSINDEN